MNVCIHLIDCNVSALTFLHLAIRAGYGSSKDISVYASLGLGPDSIHIVGKLSKKQTGACNPLADGYAAHLADLAAPGGSRPAQGNARMIIPRSSVSMSGEGAQLWILSAKFCRGEGIMMVNKIFRQG